MSIEIAGDLIPAQFKIGDELTLGGMPLLVTGESDTHLLTVVTGGISKGGKVGVLKTEENLACLSVPTPEVEPVYQYRVLGIEQRCNALPLWKDTNKTGYESFAEQDHPCRILYTHPAPSDELVKAATELIDAYNRALPFSPHNLHELMRNLDAALDKVKS